MKQISMIEWNELLKKPILFLPRFQNEFKTSSEEFIQLQVLLRHYTDIFDRERQSKNVALVLQWS